MANPTTTIPILESRTKGMSPFFNQSEIDTLIAASRKVEPATATIAYCVYENPFARSGGIYAVAANYSAALQAKGRDTIVLSPFHSKVNSAPKEPLTCVGTVEVPFGGMRVNVRILEHYLGDVRWVLFSAHGFFEASGGAGGGDPYVHDNQETLLTDSLFASAAIPYVLAALAKAANVIVHAQDWQLAATSLTVKLAILEKRLESAAVVLTTHNPYDRGLPSDSLSLITSRTYTGDRPIGTVYQCSMPLVDAPVTTVSRVFADDLRSDPLQTTHFAEHLQPIFQERGVIGVDNGLFLSPTPPFSDASVADALAGRPDAILAEKDELRRKMLVELEDYSDSRIHGELRGVGGAPLRDLPPEIPIYLMFGRLDPGQKGFDVLARAIEAIPPGEFRFVLTPIVTKESPFSDDLKQLAIRHAGTVAVYPFRMARGYMETMAGATFAVLPSLYEPFGAATEPYVMGTPVIGRATGGLCEQVADFNVGMKDSTGLLYREVPPPGAAVASDWHQVQSAQLPVDRCRAPLYGAMVASLAATISHSAALFKYDKVAYGIMLANLFSKARSFSWERAMTEYDAVYKLATG